MAFVDCKNDAERIEYKRTRKLQQENELWQKQNVPDFYRVHKIGSYAEVFEQICRNIALPQLEGRFVHFIDHRYLFDTTRGYRFENITPDYSKIVKNGLDNLKYDEDETHSLKFCADYNRTIDAMIMLAQRVANIDPNVNGRIRKCFTDIISLPAQGFEDALQRILFIDQLFWQMGHRLMGLGHLDEMLIDLYERDIQRGKINEELALQIILDFYQALHKYYWLKSNVLLGDTGQIIVLGWRGRNGSYQCNKLSYLFLKAIGVNGQPDPKVLLRVAKDMPRDLLEQAVDCMATGIGSPILANDDVIIPLLTAYGVEQEDANLYGVSACWEPLVPGKSISPNNMAHIVYPTVLQRMEGREDYGAIENFDSFMKIFEEELKRYVTEIISSLVDFRFQYNPLLSVFTDRAYERRKDVSVGGAQYNNYGMTTVGLANTVNAICNIKHYVFDEKKFSLAEERKILKKNFVGNEELCNKLRRTETGYGAESEFALSISNHILKATTSVMDGVTNYLGGRIKIGVSAPAYIDAAVDFPATFDGRKKGDPFAVHISSDGNKAYTEIINFASALDYGDNRFNGNVVDLMVAPEFINMHRDKMCDLLYGGILQGFFELQMNVVSSQKLIDAQKNPQNFQDLIVRVWGFSAYYIELPLAYQNMLIERALKNERGRSVVL